MEFYDSRIPRKVFTSMTSSRTVSGTPSMQAKISVTPIPMTASPSIVFCKRKDMDFSSKRISCVRSRGV